MAEIYSGDFIVFEGIDGVGKSTQAELLAEGMREAGRQVMVTTSPSPWYRNQPEVRSFIETGKSNLRPETLAIMSAADRMRSIDQEILPALQAGIGVICVRYTFSTFGYFKQRGADIGYVEAVNSLALQPTHGVLLRLDPELAVSRVSKRDDRPGFEERDPMYLANVQEEMLRRWPEEFLTVDASLPAAQIASLALSYVLGRR